MIKTKPLHIEDYLETENDIREFLKDMAENGTAEEFISSLNTVAKAKGMKDIAKKMGVSRTSLYKSLAENGNPHYKTINKVVEALGCKLAIV
jgi:probable addiction module antidote protein